MLNSFQQKVVGAAITCIAITVISAFIILIFNILGVFLAKFDAVIWPLAVAIVLSFMLKPLVEFIAKKLKIGMHWACWVVMICLSIIIILIMMIVLPKLVAEISALIAAAPDAISNISQYLSEHFPHLKETIAQKTAEYRKAALANFTIGTGVERLINFLKTAKSATGAVAATASFVSAFAVAPIYLYYMLVSRFDFFATLENNIKFLSPSLRADAIFFIHRFSSIMSAFFRGQMLIAFIMGLMIGVGLFFAGVKFGFLLGFLAGILNIIPYFGTMVGLGIIIPTAFLQADGGLGLALIALGVFVLVQIFEGYYLTPKIMGNKTGLHPTVIIFSVFFWGTALGGILGMILAIPLSAFAVAAWGRIRERIEFVET